MGATINQSSRTRPYLYERYPSSMEKKPKCKCRKMDLPNAGRVVVRCTEHRGKPSKKGRLLCYWDADGIVRREGDAARSSASKPRVEPNQVYFARLGDLVKVGISSEPAQRAQSFNAELIGVIKGDRREEKRLHRVFAPFHVRGEWFRADEELLAQIEELLR